VNAERRSLNAALEAVARGLAEPRHRALPRALLAALRRRRRPGLRRLGRAQARGERRQGLDQGRAVARGDVSRYPREGDFVVVSFEQDYKSSTLSNAMRKRQYWIKEEGRWKILYEGAG